MQLETREKNGYRVIRIGENISGGTDFTELKNLVLQLVQQGHVYLALSFTTESYFYSSAISALVQCLGMVREHGGKLAIVQPNDGMIDTLRIVGLLKMINVHRSEETLGNDW